MEKLAISINDTVKVLGLGRTKIYNLIGRGEIETVKLGRRRLVKLASVRALLEGGE